MSVEDRRSMIIDAVTPLLIERGRGVTSRQIAEAAGIAEGTIFRAFGDKDSLIQAVIDKHLDPGPFREGLAAIDPSAPLEAKVTAIVALMRGRFETVFRILTALQSEQRPQSGSRKNFGIMIERILAPELHQLNFPPERVGTIIRLVTLASSLPPINDGTPLGVDEISQIVLYGIAGTPPGPPQAGAAAATSHHLEVASV
jgi:AcrR family transcriptional regulator